MSVNKTGRLSRSEMKLIAESAATMSDDQIATMLHRNVATIKKFIENNGIRDGEDGPNVESAKYLIKSLREKSYYKSIKKQLSQEELSLFEDRWVDTVKQFEFNIRPTEEIQLKQSIMLDISLDRIMIERKQLSNEITRINEIIDAELKKTKVERDSLKVQRLIEELNYCRGNLKDSAKTHKDLLAEHRNLQTQLQAARVQRVDKIEKASKNWSNYLKMLDEEDFKRMANNDAEAYRMAQSNSRARLYEFVQYDDGTVDIPVLNAESSKIIEEK